MSHRETVIEPAEGLTILAGQNNCGKSAVVAALQILCGNARGDYMVRHGEKECVVEVETDEGHVVQWKRKAKTVSYTLNGREINRLKNSIPDELHELLRLPVVEADGDDFDIHFGEQKKPIFLLNDSPSRRATFFASSSDAVKLLEMQNVHRRKLQEATTRERELAKQEGQLKSRIACLEPLGDLAPKFDELDRWYKEITTHDERRLELQRFIELFEQTDRDVRHLLDVSGSLDELSQPPHFTETTTLKETIRDARRLDAQIQFNRELQDATDPLIKPPAVADTDQIERLIGDISNVGGRKDEHAEQINCLANLESPPQVDDLQSIQDLIGQYNVVSQRVAEMGYEQTVLTDLKAPPQLIGTEELREQIERLSKSQVQLTSNEVEAEESQQRLSNAEHQLLHHADELETCPVCGQDFDPEKLIASAAIRAGDER